MEVLINNDDYIIVNKPYDVFINSEKLYEKNTVPHYLSIHHKIMNADQLYFPHRLDYATSGVLCLARNKTTAAAAGKLFEKRLARKYYMAVVRGRVDFECCDISLDIGEDPTTLDTNHKMLAVSDPPTKSAALRPRSALTRMLRLEAGEYDGDPVTVLLMKPTTGRRHQLRVHSAALGHVILGDYTYSDGLDHLPHRMYLHARRLFLPLQAPLDITTAEPFFANTKFSSKWISETAYHSYTSDQEFINVCDVIDNYNVRSDRYKKVDYTSL